MADTQTQPRTDGRRDTTVHRTEDGRDTTIHRTEGPKPPAPGDQPPPPPVTAIPRRRRDKELAVIEKALQVLDGDTQATAAVSMCLPAVAGIEDLERRAAIVDLLSLTPAGMKLAKVVLEDRWQRDGQVG